MEGWPDDLASLFLLRDSLEGVVSTDDITVLQERLRLLQRQWEEVCHQVPSPHLVLVSLWFKGGGEENETDLDTNARPKVGAQ